MKKTLIIVIAVMICATQVCFAAGTQEQKQKYNNDGLYISGGLGVSAIPNTSLPTATVIQL